MMRAVIDTNVLRVASMQHKDVSDECVKKCVEYLLAIHDYGVVYIDDAYKILGEYLKNPPILNSNQPGGKFLKWVLQNQSNTRRVVQVPIFETSEDWFSEFPDDELQMKFDPPDRKFIAVAHGHTDNPPVWQAADCKWLDWWPELQDKGVCVEFLCPADVCGFYCKKFPGKSLPRLPG